MTPLGLEPRTPTLKGWCSTNWAKRSSHIDCWSSDGTRTRARGLRIACAVPLLYPTELLMQPIRLLTPLLASTTNLPYLCVSSYHACQNLPLLTFFMVAHAIVTLKPFTHFPISFHIGFHFAFKSSLFQITLGWKRFSRVISIFNHFSRVINVFHQNKKPRLLRIGVSLGLVIKSLLFISFL